MSGQDGEMALDLVQNSLDALAEVLGVRTTSAAELLADLDPGRATVIARAEAAGRIAAVHNTIAAWYQDASYVADRGCRVA